MVPRLVVVLVSLGLVVTVPMVTVSLALLASVTAVLMRSGWWRWWLFVAVLSGLMFMIDPTPFGIGEFRPELEPLKPGDTIVSSAGR